MTEADVRKLLKERLGTRQQAELARELKVSPQFFYDVLTGRRHPSQRILDYLGLKWDIVRK